MKCCFFLKKYFIGSHALGPYISDGPRMVLVFSSNEKVSDGDGQKPLGFKAKIQFKTGISIFVEFLHN